MSQSTLPRKIAFVGDYPPRLCGIATFTRDLCEAVTAASPSADCFAVAVNDTVEGYDYPAQVRCELREKELDSYHQAADFLNLHNVEVLCVQHEFGIYGGPGGSYILTLLKEARMPVVTTLHSVLANPDTAQRRVMDELMRRSDRVIVMAQKGLEILRETYGVPEGKVDVIPHGIPDIPFLASSFFKEQFGIQGRKVLMTFGLLGPGKGIEHVLEALPEIARRHPEVVYVILGATHPHLVAREGEGYRLNLERMADDLGVKDHVIFYNRFVSQADLKEFIGATDIYLTPYLNEQQITSGTLAYVFGAGKPVVSTPYWHARELLSEGRGLLVPFQDPPAIAAAVCRLLEDAPLLEGIRQSARRAGRDMIWPAVAQRYLESFQHARTGQNPAPRTAFADWTLASRPYDLPPVRLEHIVRMTDSAGIFQHATFNVPNFEEGYCTDDNARAFILCNLLEDTGSWPRAEHLDRLATSYLAFLSAALNHGAGRFRNFMSYGREWLEIAGSEDSHARALWAVGTGAGRARNTGHARLCASLFEKALAAVESFTSPRAWTFTMLGIHEYLRRFPGNEKARAAYQLLALRLLQRWEDSASADWPWFEHSVTYDNARICQALILFGQWLPHPGALETGLKSLRWLAGIQKSATGHFRPVGSNGFLQRNGDRALFDQQPVEAQAMVSACLEAFRATEKADWLREARCAFEWFLGRNDLGKPLYDFSSGGCCDGLHPDRVNENQGAESTLAFHLSLIEMNFAELPVGAGPVSRP